MTDIFLHQPDRKQTVAVVDDDHYERQGVIRLLQEQTGGTFDIIECTSGKGALAALRERKIDCILLDYNLPDMSGHEFMQLASNNGELPCAIVVISGRTSDESIAVNSMKLGARDYLSKDRITGNSLLRSITQAVTQTELRQHLASSLSELTAANKALEQEAAIRKATEIQLRAAKAAAEAASAAKTRFVAMVTHELRTPLNGIIGYAQLLRMEGGLTSLQEKRLEAMMLAGQHLRGMIESVLDFTSIEAGRFTLHAEAFSVSEFIETCVSFIGPLASERMLTLNTITAHTAPKQIISDRSRLRQVVLNLLGNAVKYTDKGSVELRILPGSEEGSLRIEVVDTGPGIEAKNHSRLFQDFERSNALPSTEGAGLGLAIAARIIKSMHGSIGYAPNPAGGSIFWLEVSSTQAADLPQPSKAPAKLATVNGLNVLLAEDVAMNRDVIGAFLRNPGHTVTFANDGRQALELATNKLFDLILMDVQMPEMNGLDATRCIRALPEPHGKVPIVALTAQSFKEQIAQCLESGMDDHVAKPVDYALLNDTIAKTMAAKHNVYDMNEARASSSALTTGASHAPDRSNAAPNAALNERFNQAKFDETAALLPPEEIVRYMEWLQSHCQDMLQLLAEPKAPSIMNDTAHTLASTGGMFGFETLCDVGRKYERAVISDVAEADMLAPSLKSELNATIHKLENLVVQMRAA